MYSQSSKETEFNIKLFSQWFHICQGVVRDLNYCRSLTTPLVCIYLTEVYCTSTVNILTSPKFTEKRKSEAYCSSTLSIKLSMTLLELLNRLDVLFHIFWDIFFFCFKQVTVRCHEAFQRSSKLLQVLLELQCPLQAWRNYFKVHFL